MTLLGVISNHPFTEFALPVPATLSSAWLDSKGGMYPLRNQQCSHRTGNRGSHSGILGSGATGPMGKGGYCIDWGT